MLSPHNAVKTLAAYFPLQTISTHQHTMHWENKAQILLFFFKKKKFVYEDMKIVFWWEQTPLLYMIKSHEE